jgi:hypothetical protein
MAATDLSALVKAGLLDRHGVGRGVWYSAGRKLLAAVEG